MFIPNGRNIVAKYGDFYWSPQHQCYVWGRHGAGIELEMDEFNQIADKLLQEHDFFGQRTVRLIPDPVLPPPPEVFAPMTRIEAEQIVSHSEVLQEAIENAKDNFAPIVPPLSLPKSTRHRKRSRRPTKATAS